MNTKQKTMHTEFNMEFLRNGDTKTFNAFFNHIKVKCRPKLLQLTKSEFDADEIFAQVMEKFWERFYLEEQEITFGNVDGYIYRMCLNAFHNMKRKRKNEKTDYKEILPENVNTNEHKSEDDLWEALKKDEAKYSAFRRAISKLCERCKRLYEHLMDGDKLKNIWEPLGYKNYQGIVQAKYNCKKELKRKLFIELENNQ